MSLMRVDTLNLPFEKWDGEYEKEFYELLNGDEKILCWPNVGKMVALDGSNRFWTEEQDVLVRKTDRQI